MVGRRDPRGPRGSRPSSSETPAPPTSTRWPSASGLIRRRSPISSNDTDSVSTVRSSTRSPASSPRSGHPGGSTPASSWPGCPNGRTPSTMRVRWWPRRGSVPAMPWNSTRTGDFAMISPQVRMLESLAEFVGRTRDAGRRRGTPLPEGPGPRSARAVPGPATRRRRIRRRRSRRRRGAGSPLAASRPRQGA